MIFSYTLLNTYENCPRQAYERYWLKIPVPETDEMALGKQIHKHLENRLLFGLDNNPLPTPLEPLEPICRSLEVRGVPETELKIAVSRDLTDTGFFDGDAYLRGVIDVRLLDAGREGAFILDWKTGKNREADKEPLQLMICAAMTFAAEPTVQHVMAANCYTKTAQLGQAHSWRRSELPDLWRTILPLIHEIEQAEFDGKWPERPSGLCGWCPVKNCQHNRAK